MFHTWKNEPELWEENQDKVTALAGPKTDWFVDPASDFKAGNAPLYMKEAPGAFTLTCKIRPFFENIYDAGSIMLYINSENWVKFAFENTDMGQKSVVSVVTDEVSDDANGEKITAESVWLKMSRKNRMIGLYYSLDSIQWKMVRLFRHSIEETDTVYAGLEAQSPLGEKCRVEFSQITFTEKSVEDFRKGV